VSLERLEYGNIETGVMKKLENGNLETGVMGKTAVWKHRDQCHEKDCSVET
jgi:hypothetical protein